MLSFAKSTTERYRLGIGFPFQVTATDPKTASTVDMPTRWWFTIYVNVPRRFRTLCVSHAAMTPPMPPAIAETYWVWMISRMFTRALLYAAPRPTGRALHARGGGRAAPRAPRAGTRSAP